MSSIDQIRRTVAAGAAARLVRADFVLDPATVQVLEEAQVALELAEEAADKTDDGPPTIRYGSKPVSPVADARSAVEAAQEAVTACTLAIYWGRVSPARYTALVEECTDRDAQTLDHMKLAAALATEGFRHATFGDALIEDLTTWDAAVDLLGDVLTHGDLDTIYSRLIVHNRTAHVLVADDYPTLPPRSGKARQGTN